MNDSKLSSACFAMEAYYRYGISSCTFSSSQAITPETTYLYRACTSFTKYCTSYHDYMCRYLLVTF